MAYNELVGTYSEYEWGEEVRLVENGGIRIVPAFELNCTKVKKFPPKFPLPSEKI
jgi:hypothetical protein